MGQKNRLALNFICKNESHIIDNMLSTGLPMMDLIVAVDTGSSDDTISSIESFGQKNNIPTWVFQRRFDNFGNSRNYALSQLRKVIADLGWDPRTTWAFFYDCDEEIHYKLPFDKNELSEDMYYTTVISENIQVTRQFMWRLSLPFEWVGPIHECIKEEGLELSKEVLTNLFIVTSPTGASWKGNIEEKYTKHAETLIDFVEKGNRQFRWVYFVAECYGMAASAAKSDSGKKDLYKKAQYWLEQAKELADHRQATYSVLNSLADNLQNQQAPWSVVKSTLLAGYNIDPRRADALFVTINHYLQDRKPQTAYLYSKFAVTRFHGNFPQDKDIAHTDESVYRWKLLFYHVLACKAHRKTESREAENELKHLIQFNPNAFSEAEKRSIRRSLTYSKLFN